MPEIRDVLIAISLIVQLYFLFKQVVACFFGIKYTFKKRPKRAIFFAYKAFKFGLISIAISLTTRILVNLLYNING